MTKGKCLHTAHEKSREQKEENRKTFLSTYLDLLLKNGVTDLDKT